MPLEQRLFCSCEVLDVFSLAGFWGLGDLGLRLMQKGMRRHEKILDSIPYGKGEQDSLASTNYRL